MGMDVYGNQTDPATGELAYFRNNAWWWRPLAIYISEIAPYYGKDSWQYNEGAGLDAEDAQALADILTEEIKSGRCEAYAAAHAERNERMKPKWEYYFSAENVQQFVDFLRVSGGFEIY